MSKAKRGNVTDRGAKDYPPVHSRGQAFVSPMISPPEQPFLGGIPDDLLEEGAPNPMGFPGVSESRKKR